MATADPTPSALNIERDGEITRIALPARTYDFRTRLTALLMALAGALILVFRFKFLEIGAEWHLTVLAFLLVYRPLRIFFPSSAILTIDGGYLSTRKARKLGEKDKRIALADIRALEIEFPETIFTRLWKNPGTLAAAMNDDTRVTIIDDYPRDILNELAQFLSPFVQAAKPDAPEDIPLVDVTKIPAGARDIYTQPEKSRIIHSSQDDLHTFIIPRWGHFGTLSNLIAFQIVALLLCGFTVFVLSLLFAKPARDDTWYLAAIVMTAIFCVFAIMIPVAIHCYFRRGVLIAAPDSLTFRSTGPLGTRELHWTRDQIRSIFVQTERHKPNVRPLRVRDLGNRRRTLVAGPDLEMRWLATQLRKILDRPPV